MQFVSRFNTRELHYLVNKNNLILSMKQHFKLIKLAFGKTRKKHARKTTSCAPRVHTRDDEKNGDDEK